MEPMIFRFRSGFCRAALLVLCAVFFSAESPVFARELRNWSSARFFADQEVENLSFFNTSVGWMVGSGGMITGTRDGGMNWARQNSGTTEDLTSVAAIGPSRAIAVGDKGTIELTTDGGEHWRKMTTSTDEDFGDVAFADRVFGLAATYDGSVYATEDAGNTWNEIASHAVGSINRMIVRNRNEAWVASDGGELWSTHDGGKTWKMIAVPSNGKLTAIAAPDAARLVIADSKGTILTSDDDGLHWSSSGLKIDHGFASLWFRSALDGWAASDYGWIWRTKDGGRTWAKMQEVGNSDSLNGLVVFDDGQGWAAGENDDVYRTLDSGRSWHRENTNLLAVSSPDGGHHAWAAGDSGLVLSTSDYGSHWSQIRLPGRDRICGIVFSDPNTGWLSTNTAANKPGRVLETVDAGAHWLEKGAGQLSGGLEGIVRNGAGTLFTFGEGGIFRSTNAGENWVRSWISDGHEVTGVSFIGRNGLAVGDHGLLLRSHDDGQSWTSDPSALQEFNQPYLMNIYSVAPSTIWVAGSNGLILQSSDGGKVWSSQSTNTERAIRDIAFSDRDWGWAVGDKGLLLQTADGGEHWAIVNGLATNVLKAIALGKNGFGYSVGNGSAILKTSSRISLPDEIRLDQSYTLLNKLHIQISATKGFPNAPPPQFVSFRANLSAPWRPIRNALTKQPNGEWALDWDPSDSYYSVPDGSRIYYRVALPIGHGLYSYYEIDRQFTYSPSWEKFKSDHQGAIVSLEILILLVAIASFVVFLTWRYRPIWIAKAGSPTLSAELGNNASLAGWPAQVIAALFRILAFPRLVTTDRVVSAWSAAFAAGDVTLEDLSPSTLQRYLASEVFSSAWVSRYAPGAERALEQFGTTSEILGFSALPVSIARGSSQPQLVVPEQDMLLRLFEEPSLIQILGVGGAGKTTLALQIARWVIQGTQEQPCVAIPVFLEGFQQNLIDEVAAALKSYGSTFEATPVVAIEAFLRARKIIVIADSVSEWDAPARSKLVSQSSGLAAFPTMSSIVTSRFEIEGPLLRKVTLRPRSLGAQEVVPFILDELERRGAIGAFEGREQLEIGSKILGLVETQAGSAGVTPLLIKLFVDAAVREGSSDHNLDNLPTSVPETYLTFIRNLDENGHAGGGFGASPFVDACMALAPAALGNAFLPGEFDRRKAEEILKDADPGFGALLGELSSAGLLSFRVVAGESLFKFTFDPLAEYLCAIYNLKASRYDASAWRRHETAICSAPGYPHAIAGYLFALDNCYATYRSTLHLPELRFPWTQMALESDFAGAGAEI